MCETIYYACESCGNSSCNGGGCEKCVADHEEWNTWRKTQEALTKEKILKMIAFFNHLGYAIFKWDKRSRDMKKLFGYW